MRADAADSPLPDDSVGMFFTDPPYYDVVPYADLSDLCYVWLERFVGHLHPDLLAGQLTPKAEQIVVNPYAVADGRGDQSPERYQERMTKALAEGRRVLRPDGPDGIGCVVFAHKGTAAWEALSSAIIDAGFIVTASWPIDTERGSRMRANKSAALGSSVHIVVRPRENADGSLRTDAIGDWHAVLRELPARMHHWMPRLAKEGVVGADAIFACLDAARKIAQGLGAHLEDLDRVHQAMVLFAAGRGEARKRFLIEEGVGRAASFSGSSRSRSRRSTRPGPTRSAGWTACWSARGDWALDRTIERRLP